MAGAKSNEESFLRNPRPAVMDVDSLAATSAAADAAGTAVAGEHPGAQTGKVSLVSHFLGVTGEAEAIFELSFPAAATTPQEALAGHI